MNEKALVEIVVPAAGETFDVYIPLYSRMEDILHMAASAISDLTAGKYRASGDAVLCDAQTGAVFDINMIAADLRLTNGSRLMLI